MSDNAVSRKRPRKGTSLPAPESEAENRRILRERELELALSEAALEPWALKFAQWLSIHERPTRADQLEAASDFAGRQITSVELKQLRLRRPFRDTLQRLRPDDEILKRAREEYIEVLPKAVQLYGEAIERAAKELELNGVDPLPLLRLIPALTAPAMDRVLPKRHEATINSSVHITLTAEQLKSLNAPETTVEAILLPSPNDSQAPDAVAEPADYEILGQSPAPTTPQTNWAGWSNPGKVGNSS